MKLKVEIEHIRCDMAARRESPQVGTVFVEFSSLCRVPHARKCISNIVLSSRDPLRSDSELLGDLLRGNPSGHAKSDVTPRSSFGE